MVYHESIRWRAIVLTYCYGFECSVVAMILGPGDRTIKRWLNRFEKHGVFKRTERAVRARWPAHVYEWIKEYIEMDCMFLIEELQQALQNRFPDLLNVSIPTICRALRNDLGLTRKVINKRAMEAAAHEMIAYESRLSSWYRYPEQLIFIDETSKDNRDTMRRYGWSKKGLQANSKIPFSRGKRVSVLAALDVSGFISWETTEGTFNRQAFHEAFCKIVLPLLNPWPFPRSIVILDNAKIHVYPELIQVVENQGALLIYLPPYSPQINPIEFQFGLLKKYLLKNCKYVWNMSPVRCLDAIMRKLASAHATFAHCGYLQGYLQLRKELENEEM
jgi:transposase